MSGTSVVFLADNTEMRLLSIVLIFCLATRFADCRAVQGDSHENESGRHRHKFTLEDLLNSKFPHAISDDLDVDVCKAGGFLGDIALPNIKYETEWRQQKLNKSYLEELEKYRDEVLKEGLQVEEEGLTEILQFKNEHDANNEGHQENGEVVASQEKAEPIMVDRNQYSMDGDPQSEFSFNARNDDTWPGIEDKGVEFRLESTTPATKKRHSARRQNHRETLQDISTTKTIHTYLPTTYSLDPLPSPSTTEKPNNVKHINLENIDGTFTVEPEATTQDFSRRRHRRHHRRRNLSNFSSDDDTTLKYLFL